MVFQRGTYRGDIIDVFPAESEKDAVRISLFDDEIEDLSIFDPLTGEILNKLPRYTIFPKTHYVTPRQRMMSVIDDIKEELQDRPNTCRTTTSWSRPSARNSARVLIWR